MFSLKSGKFKNFQVSVIFVHFFQTDLREQKLKYQSTQRFFFLAAPLNACSGIDSGKLFCPWEYHKNIIVPVPAPFQTLRVKITVGIVKHK